MPLISSFLGILIYMFKEKNSPHNIPYIHAVFAGEKMSIWIALNENSEVIKIKGLEA